jgi:hypothetical protein
MKNLIQKAKDITPIALLFVGLILVTFGNPVGLVVVGVTYLNNM